MPIPTHSTMKGQAITEFAMVLPLFLLLLFGAVELGRAFYQWQALQRAATVAARTAAMDQSQVSSNMTQIAQNTAANVLAPYNFQGLGAAQVTIPSNLLAQPVQVSISAPFNSAVGNLIPALNAISITGSSSAYVTSIGPAINTVAPPVNPNQPPSSGPPAPPPAPPAPPPAPPPQQLEY